MHRSACPSSASAAAIAYGAEITLTAETAIELGMRTCDAYGTEAHWFPRSCRSCLAEQAYKALFDHAPSCEHCAADVDHCEIGVALRRLMREGRR